MTPAEMVAYLEGHDKDTGYAYTDHLGEIIDALKANQPDMWFTIECGGAPLTIVGEIGKHKIFYRSRHGNWRLEIDDGIAGSGTDGPGFDSQDSTWAFHTIARVCFRAIWDTVGAREDAAYDDAERKFGHG